MSYRRAGAVSCRHDDGDVVSLTVVPLAASGGARMDRPGVEQPFVIVTARPLRR